MRKQRIVRLVIITCCYTPKIERKNRGSPCGPRTDSEQEQGIVNHVADVEVEVVAIVGATDTSDGFASSATGGRIASTALGGGEFVLVRLAVDNVGELVDCEFRGGVAFEPVDCVCASLVFRLRLV